MHPERVTCLSTQFGIGSSSRFPIRARKHATHTDRQLTHVTDHDTHASATAGMGKNGKTSFRC